MRGERLFKLVVVAAICLLAGCSIYTYRFGAEKLSPEDVPDPGQSRALSDVLAELGPPSRLSATPDGYVLAWESWYGSRTKIGLSLSPIGIDFFSMDWGDALMQGDFLLLHFSRDHQLVASGYDSSESNAGGGQGLQPLFGVVDVADVDDLTGAMPHHRWGGFSLNKLPVTLNGDNHMDTGQNGIQQRGTPPGVGQHSLEMRR